MGFNFQLDSYPDDQGEADRLLKKHSNRLARVPLSTWPVGELPIDPPDGWQHCGSYITGLYAMTRLVLETEEHPLGSLVREFSRAADSGQVNMRQVWPQLSQFESRLRGALACGRIHESQLDDICVALKLPPMILFNPCCWVAPPPYSRLERAFREAEHQDLLELFMRFEDDKQPDPQWKQEAIKRAVAYDRSRPERIRVGEKKLLAGLKETTGANDKLLAFLVRANQPRGGSVQHRRSYRNTIVRQAAKSAESIAWYRLQQIMGKTAAQ